MRRYPTADEQDLHPTWRAHEKAPASLWATERASRRAKPPRPQRACLTCGGAVPQAALERDPNEQVCSDLCLKRLLNAAYQGVELP